jgi:hypothetical protein
MAGAAEVSHDTSKQWNHGNHTDSDQNLRVPIRLAYKLRSVIASHRNLQLQHPLMDSIQQREILECVNGFMNGYYG